MIKKYDNLIFGLHPVEEALLEHRDIDKIMVSRDERKPDYVAVRKLAKENGIFVQEVPKEKLNRITMKNHQGIIAFTSPIEFQSLENLLPHLYEQGKSPLFLALDGVTDVRNFGALSRTAECSGVDAVIIPQKGGAPINGDAMKTSAGALNILPVCREENLKKTITELKSSGIRIVACTEKTETFVHEADLKGPIAIIMGSEEDGISPEYLKLCDTLVKIPMAGKIESLNVSVSAGIVIYESIRQRSTGE